MGEFIDISADLSSFGLLSGIFCTVAIAIFAIVQPGPSDDDDSNGGGDGGLMQPIG